MPKVTFNPFIQSVRGRVGDHVIRRCGDEYILSRRPRPSNRRASPEQIAQRERFRLAALFAQRIAADPVEGDVYRRAAKPGRTAYCLALTDRLNPPTIEDVQVNDIGRPGGFILVFAQDDFAVARVAVELHHAGTAFESGDCTPEGACWMFRPRRSAPPGTLAITVRAYDHAGNEAVLGKEVEI